MNDTEREVTHAVQFHTLYGIFPIVLFTYFCIPFKLRKIWLLIASYYFYMSWNPKYALLIGGSTLITYTCGILIEKCDCFSSCSGLKWKKVVLGLGIVSNFTILGIFKYGNFVIETINNVLQFCHIRVVDCRFDLLLPIGISFYTFQVLGYLIDVYRKDTKAERNLLRYALFVSFFPQLVAGPIERSKNLLKQMKNIESMFLWNTKRMASGSILMVWGYFQKMVIADRVAVLVNTVFDNYHMYGSTELCVAVIGFALQFYCDFGSYSLIAIGAAKIMGFELMENFNTPYFASNWNFVIWGGLHGLYQTAADFTLPYRKKAYDKLNVKTNCFSWHFLQVAVTFLLVDFAWIFFRSKSIKDAIYFIQRIAIRPTPWVLFNGGIYNLGLDRVEMNILIVSLVLLFLVDKIRYKKKMTLDVFLMEQNLLFEWLIIILLVLAIFIFGEYGTTFNAQQFIYFQF